MQAGPPRKILQGGTRLLWAKSLSVFNIIILLNKLKIVENTKKFKTSITVSKAH
jgi:hypothetical protein